MGINQSTQTSSVGTFLTFIPLLGGLIVDNEESRAALAQARSDAKAQQTDAFSKEASSTSQKVIKALAAAGIKS